MNEYQKCLDYVKSKLESAKHIEINANKLKVNYRRFEHIRRVYGWVCRLINEEDVKVNNERALKIATIFHDVGYSIDSDEHHALLSARITKGYLTNNNYDKEFMDEVNYLILNHSNKHLLYEKDTNIDLILLMEADLLDDTGALGIILDIMVEHAKNPNCDFKDCYKHIYDYSVRIMKDNPMVTKIASMYWEKKKNLVNDFVNHLKVDLDM